MPIVVVKIEGQPSASSLESGDWVISSASNSDDDPNRYLRKPEDHQSQWRIEAPKGYARGGRVVDVEHISATIFSNVSIDTDAARFKRVFLTSDRQSDWPRVGDYVKIIKNPIGFGPHLCQTPRGRITSSQPVANPGSQNALVGDEGKIVVVKVIPTAKNGLVGRLEVDVLKPVENGA